MLEEVILKAVVLSQECEGAARAEIIAYFLQECKKISKIINADSKSTLQQEITSFEHETSDIIMQR